MAKTFLPPEEIEAKVQEFLQEYHPDNTLPIDQPGIYVPLGMSVIFISQLA